MNIDVSHDEMIEKSEIFVRRLIKTWMVSHKSRFLNISEENIAKHFEMLIANTFAKGLKNTTDKSPTGGVLTQRDIDNVDIINKFDVRTKLLLRSESLHLDTYDFGRRYIGPLVWELLYHVLIQNKQNKCSVEEYLNIVFKTFSVCVCGLLAIDFLAKVTDCVKNINTNTLIYVMHEQSKLGAQATIGSFRNFIFGFPMSCVFKARSSFPNSVFIKTDDYLIVLLEFNQFSLQSNVASFINNGFDLITPMARTALAERVASNPVLINIKSNIDYIPYLTNSIGLTDGLSLLLLAYTSFIINRNINPFAFDYKEACSTLLFTFEQITSIHSIQYLAKNKLLENDVCYKIMFAKIGVLINISVVVETSCKYSFYDVIDQLESSD